MIDEVTVLAFSFSHAHYHSIDQSVLFSPSFAISASMFPKICEFVSLSICCRLCNSFFFSRCCCCCCSSLSAYSCLIVVISSYRKANPISNIKKKRIQSKRAHAQFLDSTFKIVSNCLVCLLCLLYIFFCCSYDDCRDLFLFISFCYWFIFFFLLLFGFAITQWFSG